MSNKDRLSGRLAREPFATVRKSETSPHSSVGRRLCYFVNPHSVEFTSVKQLSKILSINTEKVETYVIGRSRKVNQVCFRVVNAKHLER